MGKKKRLRIFVIIGISVFVIACLLPGYAKLQDLVARNRTLEEKVKKLTESIRQLKAEKKRLENDILYIEKVAREKLGVVRKDEVVIEERP